MMVMVGMMTASEDYMHSLTPSLPFMDRLDHTATGQAGSSGHSGYRIHLLGSTGGAPG